MPEQLLSVITEDCLAPARTVEIIGEACAAGCRFVQLRDRRRPVVELLALARLLRRLTRQWGARLLINERVDVALAVEADGVHLPATGMEPAAVRRLVGPDLIVGRSVHSAEEIERLADAPLDYVQFGPVYPTPSKELYGPPQGLEKLADAVAAAGPLPVIAVGGVSAARVEELTKQGTRGVAVIGAVMHAADPGAAVGRLLAALNPDYS